MLLDQLAVALTLGATYSLIAIGFSLTFRTVGVLNFAIPELMMSGAMFGLSLSTSTKIPFYLVAPLAALGSGFLGLFIEKVGISPIRRRKGPLANQIIATIGWAAILSNTAMIVWGPLPMAYPNPFGGSAFHIGSVPVSYENLIILASAVTVMVLLHAFFQTTRIGYAMRACADDEEAAMIVGISPGRVVSWGFFLSGSLAGLAGVYIGTLYFVSFEMGGFGLRAFAAAVLGGFGDIIGASFGGFVLGLIDVVGSYYFPSSYRDVVAYTTIILILLIRPHGLLGKARRIA